MIQKICLLGLTLCLSFCSSPLKAQTIPASAEDTSFRSVSPGPIGDSVFGRTNRFGGFLLVGRFVTMGGNGPAANIVGLYRFELPDLGAVADPFTTADFTFSYISSTTTDDAPLSANLDLYGIGLRGLEDEVLGSDFFIGPGPDTRGSVVTLQEDILTPVSEIGRFTSVDIADYLNTLYDSGNGIGQFAVFRFSPDFADTGIIDGVQDRYNLGATENDDESLRPVINFTTGGPVLLGDANLDETVDFLDIAAFISILTN